MVTEGDLGPPKTPFRFFLLCGRGRREQRKIVFFCLASIPCGSFLETFFSGGLDHKKKKVRGAHTARHEKRGVGDLQRMWLAWSMAHAVRRERSAPFS